MRKPVPATGDPERDRTTVSMFTYVLYRESYVSRRVLTRTDANSSTRRSSSYPMVVGSSLSSSWSRREGEGQRTECGEAGEGKLLPKRDTVRSWGRVRCGGCRTHP